MKKVEVFDPAMCCATGVCGVDVDPVLIQFAADLKWLESQGVSVQRYNLGQAPQAFAANSLVIQAMAAGMECLPLILAEGNVVTSGTYPSRHQLARILALPISDNVAEHEDAGHCNCTGSTCC